MTAPREPTVDELIRQALEMGDPAGQPRWLAVQALQRRGDAETFEAARRLCGGGPAERALAADVLGQLGAPRLPFRDQSVGPLTALCEPHEHPDVVHAALCALGHLDDPRALDTFLGCKDHSDPEVRFAVAANLPSAMGREEDPRGVAALGYTLQRPTEDRFLMTREELENKMVVLLGGRAAERLVFDHLSTGAADDLAKVTDIARGMVMRYGMDPKLGNVTYEGERAAFLEQGPGAVLPERRFSEDTAREIDRAVREIVDSAFSRALGLLRERRRTLEDGAQALLAKETLVEEDLMRLVGAAPRSEVTA